MPDRPPDRLPAELAVPTGPPPGWVRLSEAAAIAGVARETAWRWVERELLPVHRANAKRAYVNPAAARELARSWPCPSCGREMPGPAALTAHVETLHTDAGPPARTGWRCPAPACAEWIPDAACFAEHLNRHAHERAEAGIGEFPPPYRLGSKSRPKPCK
ncbi:MAG: hypothetical protein HZA54_01300, partial [Planctomycetes bacterium]|nr:hypothetical protein [Planctomycetota bacterium]